MWNALKKDEKVGFSKEIQRQVGELLEKGYVRESLARCSMPPSLF
jgi:hypothetical protein